jgi:hypothetical protein
MGFILFEYMFLFGMIFLMMGFIRWLYIKAKFVLSLGMGFMIYIWFITGMFRLGVMSLSPICTLIIVLGGLGAVLYNAFSEAVEEWKASLGYAVGGSFLILMPFMDITNLMGFIFAMVITVIIVMVLYHFTSTWMEDLMDSQPE